MKTGKKDQEFVRCRKEEVEVLQMVLRLLRSGAANFPKIQAALFTFEVHHNLTLPEAAVRGQDGEFCGLSQWFMAKVYPMDKSKTKQAESKPLKLVEGYRRK